MRRFLLHWLVTAIALYAAVQLVPGIFYEGGWQTLAVMALIFGFMNALVLPILKLLSCPLIILTMGLFVLVLNGVMLLLASRAAEAVGVQFYVRGFASAFWGALVISIVSFLMHVLIGGDGHRRPHRH